MYLAVEVGKGDFFLVQQGLGQGATPVCQLQGEERLATFEQGEEDEVAVPVRQLAHLRLVDPFQVPLVAFLERSREFRGREQVHEFRLIHPVADEGDDAAVLGPDEGKAGLLEAFPADAVFRRFPFHELPADAYPLVLVDVVLLLDAVQQQVLAVLFDIAEGRVDHGVPFFFPKYNLWESFLSPD